MSFFSHRGKTHRPTCAGPPPVGIDGIAISFCFPYIFTVPLSASGHGCWYCDAPIVLVMGIFQKAPRPTCKDGTFFFSSAGEGPGSGVLEDCPAGCVALGSRCFRAATSASLAASCCWSASTCSCSASAASACIGVPAVLAGCVSSCSWCLSPVRTHLRSACSACVRLELGHGNGARARQRGLTGRNVTCVFHV